MSVFWTFFEPVFHFPFDDTRVDTVPAWVGALYGHLVQQSFIPLLKYLWAAAVALGQTTLEDVKTAGER